MLIWAHSPKTTKHEVLYAACQEAVVQVKKKQGEQPSEPSHIASIPLLQFHSRGQARHKLFL
jgi:hypothetical protein